jgi:hypothetical protein
LNRQRYDQSAIFLLANRNLHSKPLHHECTS